MKNLFKGMAILVAVAALAWSIQKTVKNEAQLTTSKKIIQVATGEGGI